MSTNQPWTGDAIDVALAADFEGSLSCLGIELGTENYDMSAPLHSLIQSVSNGDYTGSHENGDTSSRESPFPPVEPIRNMYSTQAKKTRLALSAEEDTSSAIKRFCTSTEDKENSDSSQSSRCRHSSSVPDLRTTGSPTVSAVSVLSPSMLSQMLQISEPSPPFIIRDLSPNLKNTGFQYVLGAATSIATKVNEETMTYLNQGQSYEIKLKKLGDLTEMRGKLLKSIIRVGFQERRLQYSEKEQIAQWQKQRVGERILEIDIPFSYGLYDVKHDPNNIHICEFLWDPTAESGVFIKLNCISTEFTPKKHGGEKGAPFRIQIETFSDNENYTQRLHVASCQVKVFKPKGADRKHKTDREKMSKRPQSEQEKYKTSYDCTVFSECAADSLYVTVSPSSVVPSSPSLTCSKPSSSFSSKLSSPDIKIPHNSFLQSSKSEISKSDSIDHSDLSSHSVEKSPSSDNLEMCPDISVKKENDLLAQSAQMLTKQDPDLLTINSSATATSNWLKRNMFSDFVETFQHYQGIDMLRLSQDDCIKICGLTDGLRLFNTLQNRPIMPKKVIYARYPNEKVYRAVYVHELSVSYLTAKLSVLFDIRLKSIQEIQIRTGTTASFFVTDEVVINIPHQTLFVLDILYLNDSKDRCILLLNPVNEL
ncbi:transcription factor CP2-like isoform X1 [Argiope bruennichi]|uniref:Alpha-globin transcription factor CP2 like protein n=1 Tax=Argiope bruennichi TaxID=94029 RepID=A0A8T0E0A2_ARGBR|nr:transcription factor CP2-like isoform X1 [Argiope bruennichi]KAF8763381.1 Alpha-globin transcription factor CP2 like protein [Argiope bruennichi]